MRVLVTGATGFVGYAVVDRLCRDGHEVWGLARAGERQQGDFAPDPAAHGRPRVAGRPDGSPPRSRLPAGAGRVVADLRDDAAVREAFTRRFDAVCHLAALVQARGSRADPVGYWRTNVGGTLAILQALAAQEGPPARLVPKAVAVARDRAPELVVNGDGAVVRDYVHVADMADAFARALDACRPGRWTAYNVGSGRRSTIMDVVAAAEAVAGRVVPVRHDPPAAEPAELLADASRIRHDLGWRPESSDLPRIVADAYAAAE